MNIKRISSGAIASQEHPPSLSLGSHRLARPCRAFPPPTTRSAEWLQIPQEMA